MQDYFLHKIFHIYLPHMSSQFSLILLNLIFGEVAQHHSQCSVFANQQLKVSNIFLCLCCFQTTAAPLYLAFILLLTHASTRLQIAFTEQSFQPFCGNFATIVRIQNQVSALSIDPSFIFVRYFTHNQRPNCNYDLKFWRIYYNAMLHVNNVTTKPRGTCYSITLIIKSTFCSVVKFVLEVCVSVNLTCQVNTAQKAIH